MKVSAARAKQTHQTREMKELMLRNAFTFVEHVVFLVSPQNPRSQRAVEKVGGVRVGSKQDGSGRNSSPAPCGKSYRRWNGEKAKARI
jgi:RimJ/RimL family protein N-acetyltransferase